MFARRYMPSIPSLLAIEAVDRLGTASAAAAELNLTQGAVSRQLQAMEDQLGVALILREKHRLRLTPAAQDFVREARRALQLLAQSSLMLRANPFGGALNLAILPAFGMHWLAPRLADFARGHPEVTINLSTRLKPFAFDATGFDAAIHFGRQDWAGADYLKLMDEDILAVGSPGLVQKAIASAQDVLSMPLLQLDSRMGDWPRWFSAQGVQGVRPPAMLFDQFATMIQAAVHGLGLALIPTFLLETELSSGRLVPAFGEKVKSVGSYHLVWPRDVPRRQPLLSFQAWLGTQVQEN